MARQRIMVTDPRTGKRISLKEAAQIVGLSHSTMSLRHREGKRGEELFRLPKNTNKENRGKKKKDKGKEKKTKKQRRGEMIQATMAIRENQIMARPMNKNICKGL